MNKCTVPSNAVCLQIPCEQNVTPNFHCIRNMKINGKIAI